MRKYDLLALSLAASLAAAGAAVAADVETLPSGDAPSDAIAQQCVRDLSAFDEELARVGFGILPPPGFGDVAVIATSYEGSTSPRQRIRAFRTAAYIYALQGDEASCQELFASMREVYETHQNPVGIEADDPEVRTAWRRAHLARAEPVTDRERLVRADIVLGADLRNLDDERLGEIEDLVLDAETRGIDYVLVSRGGFLGFGGRLVAVRWSDLQVTPSHEIYVLDVPPRAMDEAPVVERANFEQTAGAAWRAGLDAYWDPVVSR